MHINSKRRHFATITHLPWLSRMQVRDPRPQTVRAGFFAVEIMPFGLSDQTGTVPITNERNGHLNRVVKTTTQHSVQAPDLNRNYSSHSARRQSE